MEMEWKDIDTFLAGVAELAKLPRGNAVLVRERQFSHHTGKAEDVVITEKNWDNGYIKPDFGYGSRLHSYVVRDAGSTKIIAHWGLYEFPSCCALCVSTAAYVDTNFRNRGINKLCNQFRQKLAAHQGYSALICTDVANNEPERRTLKANGFQDIFQIKNKRTGNQVIISVKPL